MFVFSHTLFLGFLRIWSSGCNSQIIESENKDENLPNITDFDTLTKTIHVFVALCDNKFQGIVPVPGKIGNGEDADNNLYWGCGYGIRTFFKKSAEWTLFLPNRVSFERTCDGEKWTRWLSSTAFSTKFIPHRLVSW